MVMSDNPIGEVTLREVWRRRTTVGKRPVRPAVCHAA
jgi:hypothetical protein